MVYSIMEFFYVDCDKLFLFRKGHSKIAASASIPSKYQTIVISKEERKGFSSGSKRFSELNLSDGPGPANYSMAQSLSQQDHVSHSKKGLGGFASKAKRFAEPWNEEHNVGPGQYEAHRLVSKKDFNKAKCTSNFHKPIADNNDKSRFQTPAPNQYNVSLVFNLYTKNSLIFSSRFF